MRLLLKNLQWHNGTHSAQGDLRIHKGVITEVGENLSAHAREKIYFFENHFAYPGLINSHDHLEMNLYPRLGLPPYKNYVEWAHDIYKPDQSPIREIERIDKRDRLRWGGLKNLISGVSTVVHHNPWHRSLGRTKFPVVVPQKIAWAHSVQLGKNIKKAFPKKNIPFVIHAAEGADVDSGHEIKMLDDLGMLRQNTVIVHGVALRENEIELLHHRQCSLIWCPASNLYMFNMTAPIQSIKERLRFALGSDSTLTGSSTLLDELRVADSLKLLTPRELFHSITKVPADIFGLEQPSLTTNTVANLFIAEKKKDDYYENLLQTAPENIAMNIIGGSIRLSNARYESGLKYSLAVNRVAMQTDVNVPMLRKKILKKVSKEMLERNPLWKSIDA